MIKWGINAINHDSSLAVFHDDKCVFASHSERFSKVKNDYFLNQKLINYALKYGMPDDIIWSEKPFLKKARQLLTLDKRFFDITPQRHLKQFGINKQVHYVGHHESHAAGAAYTSKFEKSLIFVFDGVGEFNTISVWLHDNSDIKCVYKQNYYHSIGLFYSAFTKLLNLKPNEEEFILMGMAGYGKPKYKDDLIKKFFKINYPTIELKNNLHMGVNYKYDCKFDLACSVQAVYEELTLGICSYFKNLYDINNGCFSGGCALNCMANSKYLKIFKNVWVYPNAGDAGNSYGSVLSVLKNYHEYDPYIGYDIKKNIDTNKIVKELLNGNVVGIANGKAEFGPRALGNRSLLADPRIKNIKEKMNFIKKREEFRPFAPSVLEEYFVRNFITNVQKSRYMNFIFENKYKNEYPGITHIDGTSRVQSVNMDSKSILREVLVEWFNKTRVPMLVNTSLNIKGQPLINDDLDVKLFNEKYNIKIF